MLIQNPAERLFELLKRDPFDADIIYKSILDEARNIVKAKHGNILLVQPNELRVRYSTIESNISAEVSIEKSFCGRFIVIDGLSYKVVGDLGNREKYKNSFYASFDTADPTQSEIAVGVYSVSNEEQFLLGIINLEDPQPDKFNEKMIAPLRELADQIAIVLMRAADRDFEDELNALIAEVVDGNLNGSWREQFLDRILHLVGATDGQVMRVDGDRLSIEASRGNLVIHPDKPEDKFLKVDNSISGLAVLDRNPVRINDFDKSPFKKRLQKKKGVTIGSEMVIPLKINNVVIGVINVQTERKGAFSPRHEEMLTRIAPIFALAERNVGAFDHQKSVFHAIRRTLEAIELNGEKISIAALNQQPGPAEAAKLIIANARALRGVATRLLQYPNIHPILVGQFLQNFLERLWKERKGEWGDIDKKFAFSFGPDATNNYAVIAADEVMLETSLRLLLENCSDTLNEKVKLFRDFQKRISVTLQIDTKHQNQIEILIEDNGMGVNPKIIPNLFQTNVSTKQIAGQGSGYGLPDVRRMMNSMYGGVALKDTREGEQTLISVTLRQVALTSIFSHREQTLVTPNFNVMVFTQSDKLIEMGYNLQRDNYRIKIIDSYQLSSEDFDIFQSQPTLIIIDHFNQAVDEITNRPASVVLFDRIRYQIQGDNPITNEKSKENQVAGCDVHLFWDSPQLPRELEAMIKKAREDIRQGYLIWRS